MNTMVMKTTVMQTLAMKTWVMMVLVVMINGVAIAPASAQGEGTVLCRMLSASLANPWTFDEVVAKERQQFGNGMMEFINGQVNRLTAEAKQREAVCEPYRNKSMGYDQCMGKNTARELSFWLRSVVQTTKGSTWEQTQFGSGQLKLWNSCKNPAFCEQLRSEAALESRYECPLWFGN